MQAGCLPGLDPDPPYLDAVRVRGVGQAHVEQDVPGYRQFLTGTGGHVAPFGRVTLIPARF